MNVGSAISQAFDFANQILGGGKIVAPIPANEIVGQGNQQMAPQQAPSQPIIPSFTAQTPLIMNQGIPEEQSIPYIQQLFNKYNPNSPLASPHNVELMAKTAYENKLHPAFLPILSMAETGALKPTAWGTPNANLFNVMQNNQPFNYNPYGGLNYAIPRYGQDITQGWQGQGWNNFRQHPYLQTFIQAQNPVDNPQGEIQNMLNLAQQLGVGGVK